MNTDTTSSGLTSDQTQGHPAAAGGGCCGTATPTVAEPAPTACCGTAEAAQTAGACCAPAAKAEAVAAGAGCCG